MTLTLMFEQRVWSWGWLWPLALCTPLMLGAGLLEQSTHGPVLPPNETYRTPLSKTITEDRADWRESPSQEELDWRTPKDSEGNWRTESRQTTQGPPRPGHVQVLPKYREQKDFSYNYTDEREQDQVKDNILKYEF